MIRYVSFCSGLGVTCVALMAFEARYWRWRACFNDLGRCFDEDTGTVYLEQAGIGWGALTLLGVIWTALAFRRIAASSQRGP